MYRGRVTMVIHIHIYEHIHTHKYKYMCVYVCTHTHGPNRRILKSSSCGQKMSLPPVLQLNVNSQSSPMSLPVRLATRRGLPNLSTR